MREGDFAHDLGLLADVLAPEEAHKVHGQVLGQSGDPRGFGVFGVAVEGRGVLLDLLGEAGQDAVAEVVGRDFDVAVEFEEGVGGVLRLFCLVDRGGRVGEGECGREAA